MFSFFTRFFESEMDSNTEQAFSHHDAHLPTIWLLGNTGAGKSSIIQAVTGSSEAEIGNGFRPCTMTSYSYEYPEKKPLLKFLDTRGLAEADYNPEEDLNECSRQSHALIVVMKAGEPEQSSVINALKKIKRFNQKDRLLVVHTAVQQIEDLHDRQQSIQYNQSQIESVWKTEFDSVSVDFDLENGGIYGITELKEKLSSMLPIIAVLAEKDHHRSAEELSYQEIKTDILWYASAAAGSDTIPGVGLVTVPSLQGTMLHYLANHYNVEWSKKVLLEFLATLGTGFGIQYFSKLGTRQLVKFIPVYGQTVGAATAATISFSSTLAIGRAACKYLHHKSTGGEIPEEEIRAMYQSVFKTSKEVANYESSQK